MNLNFCKIWKKSSRRFKRNLDMRIFPKFLYDSQGFLENKICHALNATLGQINLRKSFIEAKIFKMQPNALLAWQNFVMQKVGVTNLPLLKGILPSRFRSARKKLWVICSEFVFMLPSCFVFSVVTPLYFAHLDDLTVSHSLGGIQNSDWPLIVR
jgi:hypothetical protein